MHFFKGWGLSKGADELDYPLGMWDFFLFLFQPLKKKKSLHPPIYLLTGAWSHLSCF